MKNILLLMVTGLVCCGVAGCDDDDGGSTSEAAATNDVAQTGTATPNNQNNNNPAGPFGATDGSIDVSGRWLGWYELGGVKNLLSLTLTQNGPLVGGTYAFSDAGTGSIVSGLVNGDTLTLVLERNTATFTMHGRIDLDAPSYIGHWEDDERNNSGTFSLR